MKPHKYIKRLRKELNLSQKEFAEIAGVTSNYISKVERGLTDISFDKVIKVAKEYNFTKWDEILFDLYDN